MWQHNEVTECSSSTEERERNCVYGNEGSRDSCDFSLLGKDFSKWNPQNWFSELDRFFIKEVSHSNMFGKTGLNQNILCIFRTIQRL